MSNQHFKASSSVVEFFLFFFFEKEGCSRLKILLRDRERVSLMGICWGFPSTDNPSPRTTGQFSSSGIPLRRSPIHLSYLYFFVLCNIFYSINQVVYICSLGFVYLLTNSSIASNSDRFSYFSFFWVVYSTIVYLFIYFYLKKNRL